MGHFILRDTPCPKVFIGTGTGFAPLYFQLRAQLSHEPTIPTFFLFGVREFGDVFYQGQLEDWYQTFSAFDYEIFLSREELEFEKYNVGRVTNYLIPESIAELNSDSNTEFYICGSPAMVTEVR
jgi:NAD(P)H-flavin reductase